MTLVVNLVSFPAAAGVTRPSPCWPAYIGIGITGVPGLAGGGTAGPGKMSGLTGGYAFGLYAAVSPQGCPVWRDITCRYSLAVETSIGIPVILPWSGVSVAQRHMGCPSELHHRVALVPFIPLDCLQSLFSAVLLWHHGLPLLAIIKLYSAE